MHTRPCVIGVMFLLAASCRDSTGTTSEFGSIVLAVPTAVPAGPALGAARILVRGPTDETLNAAPGETVTVGELLPGDYSVVLEGLVGGEVAGFGEREDIEVSAGSPTNVSVAIASFVPEVDDLDATTQGLTFTVSFAHVDGASSYEVEAAADEDFAVDLVATVVTPPATSAEVTASAYGEWHVRVRARSAHGSLGSPSDAQTIVLEQPLPNIVATTDGWTVSPSSVPAGETVTLSGLAITNQGGTDIDSPVMGGVYLSVDPTITAADDRLTGIEIQELAAGATVFIPDVLVTIAPGTTPGDHYLGVLLDEENGIGESDEDDNQASIALAVTEPRADLMISSPATISVKSSVISRGDQVVLSAWTLHNQGAGTSGPIETGVYLSEDQTITPDDTRLGGWTNDPLAPGGSYNWREQGFGISVTAAPGERFILMVIDELDATSESDEQNNAADVPLTIIAPLLEYRFEGTPENGGTLDGFDGTATNVTYPSGMRGQAIAFDGSDATGAVFPGTGDVFGMGSKWTISFWYREEVLQTGAHLFTIRNLSRGWETYHAISPGTLHTCSDGGCANVPSPEAGVWHNIIYRYDAVSAEEGSPVDIYVDGVLRNTIANPDGLPLLDQFVADIRLGNRAGSPAPSRFFIDEVRIYDRVFTPAEQCLVVMAGTWTGSSCTVP